MIGQALLPALRAAGHETIALVRRPPQRDEARWDPAGGTIDGSALAGVQAAIHLAGATIATRWTERQKREIRESRVRGTTLLARTLAGLAPRPRVFISMSAIGIYGDRGDEILT
jgi:NAD dependent epimerase/dehydratase family enzyme